MIKTAPVTKSMIDELRTSDSRSRCNEIESLIERRTEEIMENIFKVFLRHDAWWSWEYYEGDGSPPDFDFEENIDNDGYIKLYVETCGEMVVTLKDETELGLDEGFPIRWLWEDYEKELIDGKEKWKRKQEIKKQMLKGRSAQLKEIKTKYKIEALKKLTPEELWACGLGRLPKSLRQYKDVEERR